MLKRKLALVTLVVLGVLAQSASAMGANKQTCPGRGHSQEGVIGFSDGPR